MLKKKSGIWGPYLFLTYASFFISTLKHTWGIRISSGGSRIFPRGGGREPSRGAWTRQIFPKTAWNRKNLDAQGGACVPHAPLDPPMIRYFKPIVQFYNQWWEKSLLVIGFKFNLVYEKIFDLCTFLYLFYETGEPVKKKANFTFCAELSAFFTRSDAIIRSFTH